MKVACVILGTRGDVQPMIALALGLKDRGHEAVVCAPPENEELAVLHGCPFIPFGPGIKKAISDRPSEQKGGVAVNIKPAEGKKFTADQIDRLPGLIGDADLVLGAGIVLGVHTAADILKVPYRMVIYYPIMLGTTPDDPAKSRMMFGFGKSMMNLMMRGFINKKRKGYGLKPIDDVWHHWVGDHVIVACDKELNAAREGVAFPFTQTGFMLLPSKTDIPAKVEEFLSAGPAPVYIGFGSNPIADAGKYSAMIGEVAAATGQRLLVSRGWAGLAEVPSEQILYADELPFDKVFPRLAAAVYHGGTGTLAALARAGIPQAAFPFMGDQFDNRGQIVKLGLGPQTCDFKKMTAASMAEAIRACLTEPSYRENAQVLAGKLASTDGLASTLDLVGKILHGEA